ncbi:hypothetical protein MPDQ_006081 [Monascus purpureus]|uniref:NADPH-dependent 1-acyldihydroxyacetone phosphate reductase n=1 Tax=Monascus purpureus TaxID=5098 RepID=A0A507QZ22_MONPU|nr:hypothetical protein MPDQ_006081 [Monascus purpureus]
MASEKQTVLITGCSPGGIGHALALEFNTQGKCYHVIATARRLSVIEPLRDLGMSILPVDVNSTESVNDLKKQVTELTGGKLDYLVNNAGRNYTVPALDVDIDEVQQTFETNVVGVIRMCQAFAPLLIEAKGCIVQIGSIAGLIPYVFGSVYNASKAALHHYSSTLRVELAPFGVRVVTIITGGVKSNIARVDRTLNPNSIYMPIEEEYIRRVKHSQEVGMDTKKYAASVVQQVTRPGILARLFRNRNWVWEGAKSWLVWFGLTFMPKNFFDYIMTRMFHLWKLRGGKAKAT